MSPEDARRSPHKEEPPQDLTWGGFFVGLGLGQGQVQGLD